MAAQAAARAMVEQGGGRIINMGSTNGQSGATGRSAYGVSKAGLMQLTRVMAVELGPLGIAVNAIAPGPIVTDMTHHGPDQRRARSEGHTSELQSLMRISYAVFCLKKKNTPNYTKTPHTSTQH